MSSSKDYLDVAVKAARAAGRVLMASYGKLSDSQISVKSKNDFVTVVDKRSEEKIISMIKNRFPHHSIQAEESGMAADGDTLWIIDPLDGTANYIHQFPLFCISIGVLEKNEFSAAVIYDPLHKELFTARRGQGAFLNGRRLKVSKTAHLADAMMATGIPFRARGRFDEYIDSLKKISLESAGMRRGGSAAIDLAYVACGRLDGFWEINLSPWDIAAGALLIEEAGGKVTDLWGKQAYLKSGDILASNTKIHSELLTITSGCLNEVKKT